MAANMTMAASPFWRGVRWVVWGGAAFLLLLPLVAMQFTREVNWTLLDFLVMGAMLGLACGAFELAVRVARTHVYVIGAAVATGNGFLMTWANLAVGIVGSENNPANDIFFGVLALALIATALAQLQPRGMARAMAVTAIAQAGASAVTLALGSTWEFVLTLFFVALWVISAQLFREAARRQAGAGTTP